DEQQIGPSAMTAEQQAVGDDAGRHDQREAAGMKYGNLTSHPRAQSGNMRLRVHRHSTSRRLRAKGMNLRQIVNCVRAPRLAVHCKPSRKESLSVRGYVSILRPAAFRRALDCHRGFLMSRELIEIAKLTMDLTPHPIEPSWIVEG